MSIEEFRISNTCFTLLVSRFKILAMHARWYRRASSIRRMVKGSLTPSPSFAFVEQWKPSIRHRNEERRISRLRVQLLAVSRVLSSSCTPTLESFRYACENLQERAVEISSHADRLSRHAEGSRCSFRLFFFPPLSFFLSFLLFLLFARLFLAFWVWRESRSREGFFFLFFSKLKPRVFREDSRGS